MGNSGKKFSSHSQKILTTKTQDELKTVLVDTHTIVAGDGRRSPFVVQAESNTSGDVQDKERKVQ